MEYRSCLYTKHKHQKHKTWHDGKLSIHKVSNRVTLQDVGSTSFATNGNTIMGDVSTTQLSLLDTAELTGQNLKGILEGTLEIFELERYLVHITGDWIITATAPKASLSKKNSSMKFQSARMEKLVQRKFRVPARKRSHTGGAKNKDTLPLRKKPLQPGEWERICATRGAIRDATNVGSAANISQSQINMSYNNSPSLCNVGLNPHVQTNILSKRKMLSKNNDGDIPQESGSAMHHKGVLGCSKFLQKRHHPLAMDENLKYHNKNNNNKRGRRQDGNHDGEVDFTINSNQKTVTSSTTLKRVNQSLFVSNDFDPSNFYYNEDSDNSTKDDNNNLEHENDSFRPQSFIDKNEKYSSNFNSVMQNDKIRNTLLRQTSNHDNLKPMQHLSGNSTSQQQQQLHVGIPSSSLLIANRFSGQSLDVKNNIKTISLSTSRQGQRSSGEKHDNLSKEELLDIFSGDSSAMPL